MHPFIPNRARSHLEAGEAAHGVALYLSRSVQVAQLFAGLGYDWLFLDLEHNAMDLDTAAQISVAALGAGISPVARVPARAYGLATRLLEAGALGIVMPHVDTADDAQELVRQLRYPPRGLRSFGYASTHVAFRAYPVAEAMAAQDATLLLFAVIESRAALENVAAIATVPGLDGLFIGTVDLSIDMGLAGQLEHPQLLAACDRIAAECRANGKFCGIGGLTTATQAARCAAQDIRFILAGGDLALLAAGAGQRLQTLRGAAS